MAARSQDKRRLGDFTTSPRVLVIAAIAVVVASAGVLAGIALLNLIRLATNIAYFHRLSFAEVDMGSIQLGPGTVLIPVIGALIVGLMARFGSERSVATVFPRPSKRSCSGAHGSTPRSRSSSPCPRRW